jgi:hypothetical protein
METNEQKIADLQERIYQLEWLVLSISPIASVAQLDDDGLRLLNLAISRNTTGVGIIRREYVSDEEFHLELDERSRFVVTTANKEVIAYVKRLKRCGMKIILRKP